MTTPTVVDLLDFALELRAGRILAFPASATAKHPDRGVMMRGRDGKNKPRWTAEYYPDHGWPTETQHREAFTSHDIRRLFVVCGTRSGGIVCLDFDEAGVFEAWMALIPSHLQERLYIDRSQRSGGFHVVVRVDDAPQSSPLARTPEKKVRVELRGEGGGFMAAPSAGYERVQGDLLALTPISVADFEMLVAAARWFDQFIAPVPIANPPVQVRVMRRPLNDTITATGDRPGDAYNRTHGQAEVLAMLERHGWTIVGMRGDVVDVLRPGGDSTHAVSGNVNAEGVLIVFSSSTVFAASGCGVTNPYAPFDVYAVLRHGGDYPAAARALVCARSRSPTTPERQGRMTVVAIQTLMKPQQLTSNQIRSILRHSYSTPPDLAVSTPRPH